MEDHMTPSEMEETGCSSISVGEPSVTAEVDLDVRALLDRVRVLEQNANPVDPSVCYLGSSIRELEISEKTLLLKLSQLAATFHRHWPSMQHSQRLDQRLRMLREEVRTMTQEKERGDRVWRDRLQRCQTQLRVKEEEMGRQSQYFENFKTQLLHKLSLARDREQSLQTRVHALEKQLLDMKVSTATNMASLTTASITAGSLSNREEQGSPPCLRGEGEGEEEGEKEERRRQWKSRPWCQGGVGKQGGELETEEMEGERGNDKERFSNEARLRGFILTLQEDLSVLLEREEQGLAERRLLTEQLQEAQESSHFLGCRMEEMKAEVQRLRLSENSLMEGVEELREENQRLQQSLREAREANQTVSQPSTVQQHNDEHSGQPQPAALSLNDHQGAAETSQNNIEARANGSDALTLTKPDIPKLVSHFCSKANPSMKSLPFATEMVEVEEVNLGTWCSDGTLNLEECFSEEADALHEAYSSLETQEEHYNHVEAALQQTQKHLQKVTQENTRMKLEQREQAEEPDAYRGQGRERIKSMPKQNTSAPPDSTDQVPSSPTHDNILTLAQDDLAQALNQENRALADHIKELLAHIELHEGESIRELGHLREQISRSEVDRIRLEQENQEQGCLITELTRKTEDDLNTIMELQQKIMERRSIQQSNLEELADSVVDCLLQADKDLGPVSSEQVDRMISDSSFCCQNDDCNDSKPNSLQGNASSMTGCVDQLTKSVQSLKEEESELIVTINSLKEQQRDVALLTQTQTEEKQQLTRTIWGLKEERDGISQSLASLKQQRDQLSRTVCGLRDEKDQFTRSVNGLKKEEERLTKSLSVLQEESQRLLGSLRNESDERDQTTRALHNLQEERDQLSQLVYNLKQERDELTDTIKCAKEQRGREQSWHTSKEELDTLMLSVCCLKEEKEKTENAITVLKQEEKRVMVSLQGQREERDKLLAKAATLHNQSQTEEHNQRQHLFCQNPADMANKTQAVIDGTGDLATQRKFAQEDLGGKREQSDPTREVEVLGAELRKSREELVRTQLETQKLHSELHQSERRKEESEKRANEAATEVIRMMDEVSQMEETRMENERLITQVIEQQRILTGLIKEKADALSLKSQIQEQFTMLQAQLKAKTVALEELNSEYMVLKRGQKTCEELSAGVVALRMRYNDMRAKYDALLKKRSQTDLDIAPLKAKLSCLVVKCQERNSLLVQMMRAMHRQGCLDLALTQQVEELLSDDALADYTAAFLPRTGVKIQDYSNGHIPGFILKLQDHTSVFTPDRSLTAEFPPSWKLQECQNGLLLGSEVKPQEHTGVVTSGSTTNLHDCSSESSLIPNTAQKTIAKSPVPTSPLREHASVQAPPSPVSPVLKENHPTSANGSAQAPSVSETLGRYQTEVKGESSPGLPSFSEENRMLLSSAPPSPNRCVHLNRRLSSPEKIINLHQQLQKTLTSSYQAPVRRGAADIHARCRERGQHSCKGLSNVAELSTESQTKNPVLTLNAAPVRLTAPLSKAQQTPVTTAGLNTTNRSATLFTAMVSRSASVTISPSKFTHTLSKAAMDATTTPGLSSCTNSTVTIMASGNAKASSESTAAAASIPTPQKPTRQMSAMPVVSGTARQTTTTTLMFRSTTSESNTASSEAASQTVPVCTSLTPNATASDRTASSKQSASRVNNKAPNVIVSLDGAAAVCDGLGSATAYVESAPHSPERFFKPNCESTAAAEKAKKRHKSEAPAEVGSVQVIRTVGQCSLLIGWERPPLNELGCSNGTFVYGYRVYVNGEFHKSVMSSACTKCILENVDPNVPVHISVQTLGSNGLRSNEVHIMHRNAVLTDGSLFRTEPPPFSRSDSQPGSPSCQTPSFHSCLNRQVSSRQ
ncbi:trichohyalin-like [Lampris incognitus]|uniref:trichohyalin-like n=1 Tax=Lampris incognitus TaxID=2546036 RepID=UPI0024B6166B|nr:trichohyalin-like [Lampris incognitus]